jgi:O-antigen/teichoic acid export membrane protein
MTSPQAASVTARLVANSRWNLMAFAVALLANFLVIPIVVRLIGLKAFGAAGLIMAMYAPFNLVGMVLGQAVIRELAPRINAQDKDGCVRLLSAVMFICLLSCLMVILALVFAGHTIMGIVTQGTESDPWGIAIVVCGMGWLAQQGVFVLQSVIAATQSYRGLAVANSIGAVASAACVIAITQMQPTPLGYLFATAAGFALSLLILIAVLGRTWPWLLQIRRWHAGEFRSILEFGRWQGIAQFSGGASNQIDRYVLGSIASLAVVGQYNVAMRLQEVVHMGVIKVTEVVFPHFSLSTNDSMVSRCRFFIRASWLMNIVAAAALAPLIPLAGPLIAQWVDAETAKGAAPMLGTLVTAGIIGSGANVFFYFALASDQNARMARLSIVHAVVLVISAVILLCWIGPIAAGMGYVLANLIRLAWIVRMSGQVFSGVLGIPELLQCTLSPLVGGLGVGWLFHAIWPGTASGWLFLILGYLSISSLVVITAIACTWVFPSGRQVVREAHAAARLILIPRRA